ncbi:MAG: DNA-binding protein [Desulfuromonadales bacterium]|nr:DNA-binding protein [Desulfuromonadales bacterium]
MKRLMTIFCIAIFSLSLLAGCGEDTPAPKTETAKPSAQPAPPVQESAPGKTGKVLETIDAAGYTYIQVDTGSETFWAAAPQFAAKVGDDVVVPEGMPMPDYHSKTLDRTFDLVYFVPSVLVGGAENLSGEMPADHPPTDGGKTVVETTDVDLSGIAVAEGGQTVADLFAKKADLAGKQVKVRGKVVKFTPEIMSKNWIHLQDGTGAAGTNDLTVTTSAMAKKGDTVVISGVLVIDKDFGYGYAYDVIIEDAEVTVE